MKRYPITLSEEAATIARREAADTGRTIQQWIAWVVDQYIYCMPDETVTR